MQPSIVIERASVIDGSGREPFTADVAIAGDRIHSLGTVPSGRADLMIDGRGLAVAPGFIDVHNHSDGWLLRLPNLTPKTTQGFTTEVLMSDGISYAPVLPESARDWIVYLRSLNGLRLRDYRGWRSIEEYMAQLHETNVQNSIAQIPYANIRVLACGWGRAPADDTQIKLMKREVRDAMEAGAVGLSTGLDYVSQSFASTDEIAEVSTALVPADGLYVTHVRYKKGLMAGLAEAVEIGRRAGVRVHISHLKLEHPEQRDELLEYIDLASRDVDLSFDVYPYGPGSTMMNSLLPYEAWENGPLGVCDRLRSRELRERFGKLLNDYRLPVDEIHIAWLSSKENACWQGHTLREYIDDFGESTADALADLLIEEQLAVLLVFHLGSESLVEPLFQHPLAIASTDGIWFPEGPIHPRMYGSAPRLLGPMVRDRGICSLQDAVRKLSGYPCERFGIRDRGFVREGAFADLVIFDPETVVDRATFDDPRQTCAGIHHVMVNGEFIVQDGQPCHVERPVGALPGRALRHRQ